MEYQLLKEKIVAHCVALVNEKLDRINEELAQLNQSAESDTKSSMGDKYETGREMIMQERQKIETQRSQLTQQLQFLHSVDLTKESTSVEFGALVTTDLAMYFICTAIGVINVDETNVFVISANAPVGQVLLGKEKGEEVIFNGKTIRIQHIT